MSPIKIDLIEKKKRIIIKEIKLLVEIQDQYSKDPGNEILQHAMCHAMQNAISAVIDIAQHIVAEKCDAAAESYSESILLLGEIGVLPKDFADSFSRVAKLRNVLVHLYDNVDMAFLFTVIPEFVKDSKIFLQKVSF